MNIIYDKESLLFQGISEAQDVCLPVGCEIAVVNNPDIFKVSGRATLLFDPVLGILHTVKLSPIEAYDLLTAQERIAIRSLASTDPVVKDWLHRFDIVAYQNTPFEIGPGSNWYGGMQYLAALTPAILTDERFRAVTIVNRGTTAQ